MRFGFADGEPQLCVRNAACFAKAVRDFLAMDPERFEMKHVFAFGPIESAFVAVGHERGSLADKVKNDAQLAFVFATPASGNIAGFPFELIHHSDSPG
jgi:hypothetical protein